MNGEKMTRSNLEYVDENRNDFLSRFGIKPSSELSTRAQDIFHRTEKFSRDSISSRKHVDASCEDVLWKALYLAHLHSTNEAIVDSFIHHLLISFGYFDGNLYAFPQLRLRLEFGDDTSNLAIADFTILDIQSYFRMAIFEEKSIAQENVDSRFQMIAEILAIHFANRTLQENESKKKARLSHIAKFFYRRIVASHQYVVVIGRGWGCGFHKP